MNIEEAKKALLAGHKLTHSHFSEEEWIQIDHSDVVFEDGVKQDVSEFWNIRYASGNWEQGWEIYRKRTLFAIERPREISGWSHNSKTTIDQEYGKTKTTKDQQLFEKSQHQLLCSLIVTLGHNNGDINPKRFFAVLDNFEIILKNQ